MEKLACIRTFGCQMNEHDSGIMWLALASAGFAPSDDPFRADLVLVNTCTIRQKAHHKAISEIGRARRIKRARPEAVVGVCGCVAQEEGERLLSRFPELDFVLGPDQISRLVEAVELARAGRRSAFVGLEGDPEKYRFPSRPARVAGVGGFAGASAFVTAMKGCSCSCSYCIVPSVRGKELCRPPDEIVRECLALAEAGAGEVTLLGQNVTAYSFSSPGARTLSFAALLRRISEETGISRIRFTSPHPRDVSGELIEEYRSNERLAPHIHLPVQAGSDEVLRRMRRGYGRERYLDIVRRLREARPGISVTTDLIVGFCGETEGDFELTLDLMRRVGFDSAFAFKYSQRPGTFAAERLEDDVPGSEKERRLAVLLDLQRRTSREKNESLVGSESAALVTGADRMRDGFLTGRLPDNRIIHFAGQERMLGSIVPVRVTVANDNSLVGEALR